MEDARETNGSFDVETSADWQEQERAITECFFGEVRRSRGLACTKEICDEFAARALDCDDVVPAANQGSNSYAVHSRSRCETVVFRLRPLDEATIHLARAVYGAKVPAVRRLDGFPLPTYVSPTIPGRLHVMQPFPDGPFPLLRQETTVLELAEFLASGVRAARLDARPHRCSNSSWTHTARQLLERASRHEKLAEASPRLCRHASTLLAKVDLLSELPVVLTHRDFTEVNIFVDDDGHVTGVIDFESATIEAFGMSFFGLYECFFGAMEDGVWSFHNEIVSDGTGRTVAQALEESFWDRMWALLAAEGLTRDRF